MNLVEQLADPGAAGVYAAPESSAEIEAAAQENDFVLWRVDLGSIRTKEELMRGVAEALAFPESFGENWDALEDSLTDLSWNTASGYVILLENCGPLSQADPETLETALEVFDGAAEYWYDEEVPFWVFVGGAHPAQFDLPALDRD